MLIASPDCHYANGINNMNWEYKDCPPICSCLCCARNEQHTHSKMKNPHAPGKIAVPNELRKFLIFRDIDDHDLANIALQLRVRKYGRGEQIIGQYEEDKTVYFLLGGTVRIAVYSAAGKEVTFRDFEAGAMFGELSAIDGQPRSANVVATTEAQLCCVSPAQFWALLKEFPDVNAALLKYLSGLVRNLSTRVYDFSAHSVNNRVQNEILRLARLTEVRGNTAVISPAPTHAEIASRVNAHRVAVTKEISRLARAGLIERSPRKFIVRDFAALRKMAEEVLE